MNYHQQTCSLSGCTEILPGKFWAKENCASVVTPRSQDGFSVVVESLSADCSVSTETGGESQIRIHICSALGLIANITYNSRSGYLHSL